MNNIGTLPISHPDAAFIVGVAFSASEIIEKIYAGHFKVDLKAGHEPVTIADREADNHITGALRTRYPHDSILSEENGLDIPDSHNNRAWFIDPIDGTREFIRKSGEFSIQIGMAREGRPEFGLVYQPVGRNLYIAAVGEGCWWHNPSNGWRRLQIGPRSEEIKLAISRSHPCRLAQKVHKHIGGTGLLPCGGVGLKLMAIARGQAHYYINSSNATKTWDLAAPEVLFSEAGGVVCDLEGSVFKYDDPSDYHHRHGLLAACDSSLQQQILSCIRTCL